MPRIPLSPPKFFMSRGLTQEQVAEVLTSVYKPGIQDFVRSANAEYVHWDRLRFKPLPEGADLQTIWDAIALSRSHNEMLPLTGMKGRSLTYWVTPQHHEWLSFIDNKAGGYVSAKSPRPIPDDNKMYLYNSLMEEAIASSMLEGAATTREIAKDMLRSQRRPKNRYERMVLNNYKAILEIKDLLKEQLTPEMIKHLHTILCEGTMEKEGCLGRYRRADENINVEDARTNEIIYTPPLADVIEARIKQVCDLANNKSKEWIHPVLKAIALHFAIGFIHPFTDGNGRTARAIFYWYMLKHGYWMFEYLPISRILIEAPAKYASAYLYTESDSNDLNYFFHFNLKVIIRAINDLHVYLDAQQKKVADAQDLIDKFPSLNLRQRMLMQEAIKNPGCQVTTRSHEGKYQIAFNTARNDLDKLVDLGIFRKLQATPGKEAVFMPSADIIKKLKQPKGHGVKKASPLTTSKKRKTTKAKHPNQPLLFEPDLFDEM
jgi:Fic family protein